MGLNGFGFAGVLRRKGGRLLKKRGGGAGGEGWRVWWKFYKEGFNHFKLYLILQV